MISAVNYFYTKEQGPAARALFVSGWLLFLAVALGGCSDQPVVAKLAGQTMGTQYHITIVAADDFDQTQVSDAIEQRLQDVNQLASTYLPDSTLSRLNRAPVGEWQTVPAALLEMLVDAQWLHDISAGAFDITVGPLVDYWGFGAGKARDAAASAGLDSAALAAEIQRLKAGMGMAQLEMDTAGLRVRRLNRIELDLSAIAKGYGVDVVAALLTELGYRNYLVEIGGEIRVAGVNGQGLPWRIGIETPALGHAGVAKALQLDNKAVATSGDYRNYYEEEGRRISHMIDPRTGYPITHNLASVTVVADSTARADGLATTFSVMGLEAGLALANSEKIAAYFLVREEEAFKAYYSEAFAGFL